MFFYQVKILNILLGDEITHVIDNVISCTHIVKARLLQN